MIIGLVGFIGAGKNTVGDILEKQHGFVKESFAKGVKDVVSLLFDWNREMLEGEDVFRELREKKNEYWSNALGKETSPRKALQWIGQGIRDIIHPDFWVITTKNRIMGLPHFPDVVITDVRYPNEIQMIHKVGGKIVWIQKGMLPDWYDDALNWNNDRGILLPKSLTNVHVSERAWIGEKIDATIYNNYSFEALRLNIDYTLDILRKL